MATTTFGRAAHVTRRAAITATPIKLIGGVLAVGWVGVAANRAHLLGNPMPLEWLVIALSALIVASLLVGLVWILRGPGYYKAMRFGESVERERQRCAARSSTAAGSRVGTTIG